MRYALINNGVVEQLVVALDATLFVGDYEYVIDVTEKSVAAGHLYQDGVFYKPEPGSPGETPNYLFLHIDLSDGDGIDPIGMLNNGIDTISIAAAFRETEDPASAVLTVINGMWRVVIRDSDNLVYDIIGVNFTNGESNFQYTTSNKAAICTIKESDLNAIPIVMGETTYKIKLVNPVTFKVYRVLSSGS